MIRNLGIFELPSRVVENNTESDALVEAVMANCRILRAEAMVHKGCYEYVAISDKFRHVDEGVIIPTYRWELFEGKLRAV